MIQSFSGSSKERIAAAGEQMVVELPLNPIITTILIAYQATLTLDRSRSTSMW